MCPLAEGVGAFEHGLTYMYSPCPPHNLRETSACSHMALAGVIDTKFLKATKQKKNTTKAYSLIKDTSQIQSEDLKIKQPPPGDPG